MSIAVGQQHSGDLCLFSSGEGRRLRPSLYRLVYWGGSVQRTLRLETDDTGTVEDPALVFADESTCDGMQGRNCGARQRPPGPALATGFLATELSRERWPKCVGSAGSVTAQAADRGRGINGAGDES
jgi:hypothetical protein